MKSLSEIREDLKEIRYYYSRKKYIEEGFKVVGTNNIKEKAEHYNSAVRNAPARLYDLYINLYINGYTQEALAEELNYTAEYIRVLNKRLLLFLQEQTV